MPHTSSLMDASPLGRSSPTEGNISRSPFIDCHDAAWDAHTSALFSERCQLYGEEWRGRRAASDTFPPLRDMVSSLPRIWHSSESLPPLSLPATLRRDMQDNAGISFSITWIIYRIQSVVKILETTFKTAKKHRSSSRHGDSLLRATTPKPECIHRHFQKDTSWIKILYKLTSLRTN